MRITNELLQHWILLHTCICIMVSGGGWKCHIIVVIILLHRRTTKQAQYSINHIVKIKIIWNHVKDHSQLTTLRKLGQNARITTEINKRSRRGRILAIKYLWNSGTLGHLLYAGNIAIKFVIMAFKRQLSFSAKKVGAK